LFEGTAIMAASIREVQSAVRKLASREKARSLQRFFKTGPGEYGEGDVFLGITVPQIRKLVRKYKDLDSSELTSFLRSAYHEERLFALLGLVQRFQKGSEDEQERIFQIYLKHIKWINNWDLVDLSACQIIGAYLDERNKTLLSTLARSKNLWERRIAILATFHFIRSGRYRETLRIAGLLLEDQEDLIHKAVGWMLREVGKRDQETEEEFLKKHYESMPRTMLRYAIERFSKSKRQAYLRGKV
jgi:3-methyladenine DNA glycosylase AlkD